MGRDEELMPPRLVDGRGPAADALRRYRRSVSQAQSAESGHSAYSEGAAWNDTLVRLAAPGSRRRRWLGLAALGGAVGGALALYLVMAQGQEHAKHDAAVASVESLIVRPTQASGGRALSTPMSPAGGASAAGKSPEAKAARPAVALPVSPSVLPSSPPLSPFSALREGAVGLPWGASEIANQAGVMLVPGGKARAHTSKTADGAEETSIDLLAGKLELEVVERGSDHPLQVVVKPYRFVVLGARFQVDSQASAVRLSVDQGRVVVFKGMHQLREVHAGEKWAAAFPGRGSIPASKDLAGTSVIPAAAASVAPMPFAPAPRCASLATRDIRGGLACYEQLARGAGLPAEVASYEGARMRRDSLGDAAGALSAFLDHRRRFPTGTLAREVDLSIVELLAALGRHDEALAESNRLLRALPEGERAAELHLLRGHLLREKKSDLRGALHEYAEAAKGAPSRRVSDPAAFWQAVCLERLGRVTEARDAYRAYLERPGAGADQAAEAQRRLRSLDREHSPSTRL